MTFINRQRRPRPHRPVLKSAIFELRMVGSDGRVFAVSTWDDDPDGAGHPANLARLMREVTGLCVDPGDRGMLYSYPTPEERDDFRFVATFGPTGGDRYVAIRKALRGLQDGGAGWVTPGVIERVAGLVHACALMHLAEAWVIDALDAEPSYPGEGKDWHIAAIMRAMHAALVEAGVSSWAVESDQDVLVVERTMAAAGLAHVRGALLRGLHERGPAHPLVQRPESRPARRRKVTMSAQLDGAPITVRMIVEHVLAVARLANADSSAFADRDADTLAGYILYLMQDAYCEALHYVGVPGERVKEIATLTMADPRASLDEVLAEFGINLDGGAP